ncbi:MAG: C-type lectin domain-containing protein [Bifidobacteriaceae bacterium]|jgi:hypothetical protein|nr:C-type lectin domain-containing protein [Bifidobacteriaceae bacterium]
MSSHIKLSSIRLISILLILSFLIVVISPSNTTINADEISEIEDLSDEEFDEYYQQYLKLFEESIEQQNTEEIEINNILENSPDFIDSNNDGIFDTAETYLEQIVFEDIDGENAYFATIEKPAPEQTDETTENLAPDQIDEILKKPLQSNFIQNNPTKSKSTRGSNGHLYALFDELKKDGFGYNWDEAQNICETNVVNDSKGHLASITSSQIQNDINKLLDSADLDIYWTGADKSSDNWSSEWEWFYESDLSLTKKWDAYDKFKFTNWAEGQPGSDYFAPRKILIYAKDMHIKHWNNFGNVADDLYAYKGQWNDFFADKTDVFGDNIGALCEWDDGIIVINSKHNLDDPNYDLWKYLDALDVAGRDFNKQLSIWLPMFSEIDINYDIIKYLRNIKYSNTVKEGAEWMTLFGIQNVIFNKYIDIRTFTNKIPKPPTETIDQIEKIPVYYDANTNKTYDLSHLSAAINGYMKYGMPTDKFNPNLGDFAGWAGDLLTLGLDYKNCEYMKIENANNLENNWIPSIYWELGDSWKLNNCNDSTKFANEYFGFKSNKHNENLYSFSWPDLVEDIDAINLTYKYNINKYNDDYSFSKILQEYLDSLKDSNRFKIAKEYRFKDYSNQEINDLFGNVYMYNSTENILKLIKTGISGIKLKEYKDVAGVMWHFNLIPDIIKKNISKSDLKKLEKTHLTINDISLISAESTNVFLQLSK